MMDRQGFQDLVDAYGTDQDYWPDDRIQAARIFLRDRSTEAEAVLVSARTLDAALRRQAALSPKFRHALATLATRPRGERFGDFLRSWWRTVAPAVAASALLGFVLGSGLTGLGFDEAAWADDGAAVNGLLYANMNEEGSP